MILYIGSEKIYKEIESTIFRYDIKFNKINNIENIKKIYKELQDTECTKAIIDISSFNNSYDEIILELKKINENIKIDIAIIDIEINLLKAKNLEMIGYKNILEFIDKVNFKKSIIDFLRVGHNVTNEYFSPVEKQIYEYEDIEEQKIPPVPLIKKARVTIGIGGILPRMGSTTLAIQMMRYLKSIDRKSLYVEMGKKELLLIKEIYENYITINNQSLGFFICDGLDFLYKVENLDSIINNDEYDFIIFDYGDNVTNNNVSFINQDVKCLLCGMSPSEMLELEKKLEDFDNQDIEYFFNLTAPKDRTMILNLMKYKRDNTYFLDFTPDYFSLNQEHIKSFESIFATYLNNGIKSQCDQHKKNSFFERFKR